MFCSPNVISLIVRDDDKKYKHSECTIESLYQQYKYQEYCFPNEPKFWIFNALINAYVPVVDVNRSPCTSTDKFIKLILTDNDTIKEIVVHRDTQIWVAHNNELRYNSNKCKSSLDVKPDMLKGVGHNYENILAQCKHKGDFQFVDKLQSGAKLGNGVYLKDKKIVGYFGQLYSVKTACDCFEMNNIVVRC